MFIEVSLIDRCVYFCCRPRPTAGAGSASHNAQVFPGSISQPGPSSAAVSGGSDPFKQPTVFPLSANQQAGLNNNTGLTNGGMGTGALGPAAANAQNPFDTAWALRHNTSTNPFLAGASPANTLVSNTPAKPGSQPQFSKEFELKM